MSIWDKLLLLSLVLTLLVHSTITTRIILRSISESTGALAVHVAALIDAHLNNQASEKKQRNMWSK